MEERTGGGLATGRDRDRMRRRSRLAEVVRAANLQSAHAQPASTLKRHLKLVHSALARVVLPLADGDDGDEAAALDDLIQALVVPELLHHDSRRLQGLVLACLREALRVCRLGHENDHRADDDKEEEERKEGEGKDTQPAPAVDDATGAEHDQPSAPPARQEPSGNDDIWLMADDKMCEVIKNKDWAATPFGPLSTWPNELKMALGFCLFSRFPMVIRWGPDYRMIYNGAYTSILASLSHGHRFLGEAFIKCWPNLWEVQRVLMDGVVRSRTPVWVVDDCLPMIRNNYIEETYFSYSYSPLFVGSSATGLLTVVLESTNRVIAERQLRALNDLATRGVEANTLADAVRIVMQLMDRFDIAFANLYVLDERNEQATLAGTAGDLQRGSLMCPEIVTVVSQTSSPPDDSGEPRSDMWCSIFNDVVVGRESRLLDLVSLGSQVPPCSAWSTTNEDRPRACVVLPLMEHAEKVFGILVAGVNPRHNLDDNYRIFLKIFSASVASIMADATAREQERQRVEALAELDRAKTLFFSNISHEFRTPLTLLLGPLEDLLGRVEWAPAISEQLKLIHRNGLRLYKLVDSLLDFSSLETGRTRATFEPVGLASLTHDLVSIFQSAIKQAGLALVTECDEELEEPVYVDKDMWEKVVFNLLSNALKFTVQGQIHVAVRSLCVVESDNQHMAELMVADTGVGIPQEDLQLLGTRFHRVSTPDAPSREGTGIGLALAFELVRLHGGTVSVTSQLGKGTTFRVRIPFGTAHLPSDQIKDNLHPSVIPRELTSVVGSQSLAYAEDIAGSRRSSDPGSSSSASSEGDRSRARSSSLDSFDAARRPQRSSESNVKPQPRARILLADDNDDMREYVARLLSAKYDVIKVSNGKEAMHVLKSNREHGVDLVLTDVMMPLLDGFGLLKKIRSRAKTHTLPVIMLSARAGEDTGAEGLDEGADDYLSKPFTARQLLSRIASQIHLSRMRLRAARIEKQLRCRVTESKKLLEGVLASIQDAFLALDDRQRYTFVNANAARLLEAGEEEIIGQHLWRFMTDTENKDIERSLEHIAHGDSEAVCDYYQSCRHRWYKCRMYPGLDGGASLFIVDTTARRKAELRLLVLTQVGRLLSASIQRQLTSLLSEAIDSVAGSVVADWCIMDVVDERGNLQRIASANAATELWQLHVLESDSSGQEDLDRYHTVVRLSNGDYVGVECGLSLAEHDFMMCLLLGHDRVCHGVWLFARDQSASLHAGEEKGEDRAVCEELARRAGMAVDNARLYHAANSANQAKDHFLAALSHELRTPLTPVLLLAESLLGDGTLTSQAEESVRMIRTSVEREVRLIDDLLDLTKISQHKLTLLVQDLAVHDVLRHALSMLEHEVKEKRLAVQLDLRAEADQLVGDPTRLRQVFCNLLENAIKFTPAGGVVIIRTSNCEAPLSDDDDDHHNSNNNKHSAEAEDKTRRVAMMQIEITDTGIGIESHVLPRLFRAFEQGDAGITARFGGLGLGLSISQVLVQMHRGKLTAFSAGKDQGATFTVQLPITSQLPSSPSSSSSSVATLATLSTNKAAIDELADQLAGLSLRVLLVEDNQSTLMIMSRLLRQRLNCQVLVATSVAEATAVADRENEAQFDLLISDVGLPDGTGHQLVRALKAKFNIKAIALSGYGQEEDLERSREAGFDVHLIKPVQLFSLSTAIRRLFL